MRKKGVAQTRFKPLPFSYKGSGFQYSHSLAAYFKRHTMEHQYFPKPLDEEKELNYLLEPLVTKMASQQVEAGHDDTTKRNLVSYVQSVRPVLQKGPMCGLVALTMASEQLNPTSSHEASSSKSNTHPGSILEFARQTGLTKHGEMFSAQYMKRIIQEHLSLKAEVLRTESLSEMELIGLLLSTTKTILVPYDADKNHTPCLAMGHKAHWCLLVGFVVCLTTDGMHTTLQQFTQPANKRRLLLKEDNSIKQLFLTMLSSEKCCINELYIFARHGKSRYGGLWSWTELKRSNENLLEIDPRRTQPGEYVFPTSGSIIEGLCNQIVIVSNQ